MRIEAFLKYLQNEKRCSPHTTKAYKTDLGQFFDFLGYNSNSEYPTREISHPDIRNWLIHLVDAGISNKSINRKLITLNTFFKYLLKERKITSNPLAKIISPKTNKVLPLFMREKEINMLLDATEVFPDNFEGFRNRLMIELLYLTGIRSAELIGLNNNDLDIQTCTIKVTGKRNKQRIIPFTPSLKKCIDQYQKYRDSIKIHDQNAFFITKKGKRIYPKLLYNIVRTYLEHVTTINKKSPHILRHSFATHMLNNGADLNAIKELLGHSNLKATEIYTHTTYEKLKSIYEQAHPRA